MTLRGPRTATERDGRAPEARPFSFAGVELSGCRVARGKVNAHDHLEFALFPRLGRGPYSNARAWAEAIHREGAETIALHRRVPLADRLRWGGLRNMLSGATAVYEHNPYRDEVFDDGFPVRVMRSGWAHSLDFGDDVAESYRRRPVGKPFFVHAGEGTDAKAAAEVFELDRLGVLGPDTVLVHAVGFDEEGWALIRQRGARVAWCPTSNRFTLGRTLNIEAARGVQVLLGTDSPLTAAGDLLDELGEASAALCADDDRAWAVFEGGEAWTREAFVGVFRDAAWWLVRADFAAERCVDVSGMQPLAYAERRYWVRYDVSGLLARTRAVLGDEARLAGKAVALWR